MHLSVFEQSEIFYYSFVFGIGLGAFYDVFRLIRSLGLNSKKAVFIEDITFMVLCSVACSLFAQVTVNGHLRLFTIFAHTAGFVSYRFSVGLLSGYIFKIIGKLIKS
ncbi:MAG: spore cortex biosynthesis protein YabQ, partial [Clostridia bacterium]|nr:spore cortex biosynthesis protein YabQ [Clostridia bacterium]